MEAERYVLGSVLVDPEVWPSVSAMLTPGDFALEAHRKIWQAVRSLDSKGAAIDRVSVADELTRMGNFKDVGGFSYLVSLDEGMPQVFNVEAYAEIVKRCSRQRDVIYAAQAAMDRAFLNREDPDVIAAETESRLRGITSTAKASQLLNLEAWMQTHREEILDPSAARSRRWAIKTGLARLDEFYDGFEPGKLVILAARPSVGKSVLGAQFALRTAESGRAAAFFSLEMDPPAIYARLICGRAGVSAWKHKHGHLNEGERRAYAKALGEVGDMPLFIQDTPSMGVSDIRAASARLAAMGVNLGMKVVDYLGLLHLPRAERQDLAIGEAARALKLDARESNSCNICIAQLGRSSEKEKRRPTLSDLQDSGKIEQHADDIIFIHRDDSAVSDRRTPHPVEIIVAKQRGGIVANCSVLFNPQFVRFEDKP